MMKMQSLLLERSTVLVVGAGPVGLASALACHALGLSVAVLEADPENRERPGSRSLFLHYDTLCLLQRIDPDLANEIASHGVVWERRETLFRGRRVFEKAYPPPRSDRLPPFVSLRQPDTEYFLRLACARSGVPVMWEQQVASVTVGKKGAVVQTTSGINFESDYVIAADGARSALRRSLGIEIDGTHSRGFHVVIDIADDPTAPRDCVRTLHYEHPAIGGRTVLLVPFKGGFQVDLQCREDDDPEVFASDVAARQWLPQVTRANDGERIMWISRYHFLQCVAQRFTDPKRRVLLVGDAAHLFPPFGARGLNSGIADGEAAAMAITVAIAARGETRRAAAIDDFAIQRRQAALNNSRAAGMALAHLRPPNARARIRRHAAALFSPLIPAFGRWLEYAPYGPRFAQDGLRRY